MSTEIVGLSTYDVRFPTSRGLDGSDAMNPDPDCSAAYVVIHTDAADGIEGHGFAFTIGRGNDVQVKAIESIAPLVVGRSVDDTVADLGGLWKRLVHDSPLRWLGPEKGVMHMAIAAVVNALWDLAAKRAGKPVWKLLADMAPDEIVALVDFRYLTDALTATKRSTSCTAPSRARPSAKRSCCATAIPPTPARPAGSATATPSWWTWRGRRSPTASGRSS